MKLFCNNEKEEIYRNVQVILATLKTTCPLDRDFGLDGSFIDQPTPKACAILREEIVTQLEKYEPRAKVRSITFQTDNNGKITPKVVLINE